jgi:hypothetical protein
MRDAVSVARKANRFVAINYNEISLSIENSLHVSPESLTGCIVSKPSESPSRIIRRVIDIWDDLRDKDSTVKVLERIQKQFREVPQE